MAVGSKPCLVFEGSGWEHNPDLQKVQNYFTGSSFVRWCLSGENREDAELLTKWVG
jgi:hypothetical protein